MIDITRRSYIEALNRIANTDDGKIFLAALADACKWDLTILDSSSLEKSLYYAAKRGVYGAVRKDIKPEYRKIIENDYQIKQDVEKGKE